MEGIDCCHGCLEQGWAQVRDEWARVSTRICRPGPKKTTDLCSAGAVTALRVVLFFRKDKALVFAHCPSKSLHGLGLSSVLGIRCP